MSGRIELVIFDCDGVLVDSEPIAVRVDLVVLAQFGLRLSQAEVIKRFVGRSPEVMLEVIEAHVGRRLPDGLEPYEHLYQEAFEAELTVVDGITEALDQITQTACVASSSKPDSLRRKLQLTGLYERFDGRVFSATEVREGKPAPDLFLHAADKMGVPPSRCVVVEDSRHGVDAARAAHMDAFAYSGGLTEAHALAGPRTTVFNDMRRLPELLRTQDPN
jgi:HAD superfamily hydrolase (TIGR01509 family)